MQKIHNEKIGILNKARIWQDESEDKARESELYKYWVPP